MLAGEGAAACPSPHGPRSSDVIGAAKEAAHMAEAPILQKDSQDLLLKFSCNNKIRATFRQVLGWLV